MFAMKWEGLASDDCIPICKLRLGRCCWARMKGYGEVNENSIITTVIVQRRKRKIHKSLRERGRGRKRGRGWGRERESFNVHYRFLLNGSGDSSVIERRTHDRKVAGHRIVFSRVNLPYGFLFWYPFHPRFTAAARKRLLLLLIAFIQRYSPLSSRLTALACDSTWVTSFL